MEKKTNPHEARWEIMKALEELQHVREGHKINLISLRKATRLLILARAGIDEENPKYEKTRKHITKKDNKSVKDT